MKKKSWKLSAALLSSLMLLSACGGGGTSSASSSPSSSVGDAPTVQKKEYLLIGKEKGLRVIRFISDVL